MAIVEKNMGSVTLVAGKITCSCFYDDTKITSGSHIPPIDEVLLTIGDVTEDLEDTFGMIQLGEMNFTLREVFTDYASGLWKKMFTGSETNFRFYLDEGAGDTFLFYGRLNLQKSACDESVIVNGVYMRSVKVNLDSMLIKIKESSIASIITEIIANDTNYERLAPFIGHFYDVLKLFKVFGCIYKVAFGSSDVDSTLENSVHHPTTDNDIQFHHYTIDTQVTWHQLKDLYIQTKAETQQVNGGTLSPYFDSNHSLYWGTKFQNGLELLAYLCRNFLVIPRYFYGLQDNTVSGTASNNKHRLMLVKRGRSISVIMNNEKSSRFLFQTDNTIEKARINYRYSNVTSEFDGFSADIDFGIGASYFQCLLMVYVFNEVSQAYFVNHPTAPFCKVYDYKTGAYQELGYFTSFLETLEGYYEGRFSKKSFTYFRTYKGLKATVSGVETHNNMIPYCSTSISDGSAAKIFFAFKVSKRVSKNELEVQWVEE